MAITPSRDGLLTISVGKSRYEKKWKNKEISWSDLLGRFSKTQYTHETHAEYLEFPKGRQDEIKDVGGFVGGVIHGGRRKPEAITARSMLTLDIDFGDLDFWNCDFKMSYSEAAAIYSTHKHHPDSPRYRLIMPLSREVFADEYQAIARRIAETLNIEIFDITTYQPERLMYWPSTPKDQPYYFEWQDGPWIDADAVLATYRDWRDTSQWPMSRKERDRIVKAGEKQGEPTEKSGVVGAFCRIYGIVEAIETYLPEIYLPTDKDDRWTYAQGSTSGGLVIYDNKWAYSHHGTDPISGKLCNAFDLVRLHKYGAMDEDVDKHVPINKRPSHIQMENYGLKDKRVNRELVEAKLLEINADFKFIADEEENIENEQTEKVSAADASAKGAASSASKPYYTLPAIDEDWIEKLESDRKGNIQPTTDNIYLILQNDPALRGCFGYDDFRHIDTAMRTLPWRYVKQTGEPLIDGDDSSLQMYIEKTYKIWSPIKVKAAFIGNRNVVKYHPVKDYLATLMWDGEQRVDTLLTKYFGVDDNVYTRSVMRKSLCAAVARIFEPGCKFDNVLVLVGPEGTGKSMLFDKLGGKWFSDSLGNVDSPRVYEQLQGAWIIELPELRSLSDSKSTKHFFGKRSDRFRVAYGVRVEEFPRQCIFFGTTNEDRFLEDDNGDRRFWPVRLKPGHATASVFNDLNEKEIDQIWAEVVEFYRANEPLTLPRSIEVNALANRKGFTEYDARLELIWEYLKTPIAEYEEGTPGELREDVSYPELWTKALGGLRKDVNRGNTRFITKLMDQLKNWEKIDKTYRKAGVVVRGFRRIKIGESGYDPNGDDYNDGLIGEPEKINR